MQTGSVANHPQPSLKSHSGLSNNKLKLTIQIPTTKKDAASVSSQTTNMVQMMNRYNALTHINGQEIRQLRAINNILTIMWDIPYRFQTADSMFWYIKIWSTTNWSNLFSEVYREIGAEGDFFGNDVFRSDGKAFAILSKLAGGIGEFILCMYCRSDIIATLNAAGIQPGWAEINIDGQTNRFYFAPCGTIQSERTSNNERQTLNRWDFRENGFVEGDKIMVNFEYYTVGADGRIYVPEGVPVIKGTTFWHPGQEDFWGWGQDESGAWHRTRDFPEFISVLDDRHWDWVVANRNEYSPSAATRYGNVGINATLANITAQIVNHFFDMAADTNVNSAALERNAIISRIYSSDSSEPWRWQFDLFRELRGHIDESGNKKVSGNLEGDLQNVANAYKSLRLNNADANYNSTNLDEALLITATSIFLLHSQDDNANGFLKSVENARQRAHDFVSEILK